MQSNVGAGLLRAAIRRRRPWTHRNSTSRNNWADVQSPSQLFPLRLRHREAVAFLHGNMPSRYSATHFSPAKARTN